jgi:CelD/BcsL family acetyltransferase involved in cellulose biosynthesis
MTGEEELDAVAGEWDELADGVGAGPFVRPGWFGALSRAFGGRPGVLTVRAGRRLTGALPVLRDRAGLRSPTNWHTPLYGPVVEEAAGAALAAALVERPRPRIDLSFIAEDDPFGSQYEQAARSRGFRVISRSALRSPFIELAGDMETFQAGLPTKFVKELERRKRRLGEQGEVSVRFGDGGDRLDALLDEGFAIEHSGWKHGTAIAADPAAEGFYRDVAHWAAERGWLHLGVLRLDDRQIAFSYCLAVAGTMNVVKVGFDPEFRRYAPGSILTQATIESSFAAGLRRYDFLGAEDAYKLDWTSQVSERLRIQAFAPTPAGRAQHLAWRYARPGAKAARASAKAWAARARSMRR